MFGSEFTAVNNVVDIVEALHYNLHMFGVPINESMNIFCGNGSVSVNTTWS